MSKISELSDGGSLVSTDFLIAVRSGGNVKVQMDTINVDQVDLGDNEFIRLGNSQDLTLVHTSTQSIINQAGVGDLLIQKGAATKLTVNSSGIDVTGTVTATTLSTTGLITSGSGSTTSSGLQMGYGNATGWAGLWHTASAINLSTTYVVANNGVSGNTIVNSVGSSSTASIAVNGATKLSASSSGIDVTGSVTADGLTVGDTSASQSLIQMLANPTNGANTIHFGDGTSAAAYVGYINYAHDSNSMQFSAGGSERLRIDGATGKVSIGIASGDGTLHVHTASAGAVAASAQADDLVIENSTEGGMTIITPDDQSARIRFTSPSTNNDVGGATIFYRQNINKMQIGTAVAGGVLSLASGAGNESLTLASSGAATFSSTVTSTSFASTAGGTFTTAAGNDLNIVYPDGRSLFIKEGSATHVTVDNAGNVGLGTTNPAAYGQFTVSGAGNLVNLNAESGKAYQGFFEGGTGRFYLATLNGSKGLAFVDGNGSTERGRFDANGNFLVRQSSPQVSDTHNGATVEQFWGNQFSSSNSTNTKVMIGTGSSEGYVGASRLSSSGQYVVNSYLRFDNTNATAGSDAGQISFFTQTGGTNAQTRMVLDASGNLLVSTTDFSNPASGFTVAAGGETKIQINHANGTGSGVAYATFRYNQSTVGSITQHGTSATLYNTSSDQRLKSSIADADDAGSKIDSIQVRKFDWKADGSHQDYGMIAQELQVVAPEAVSAPEDPEEMMGVDYSKLVPMMLKEIQSLRARIAALES